METIFLIGGLTSALCIFLGGLVYIYSRPEPREVSEPAVRLLPLTEPVRKPPDRFPPNTHLPPIRESRASGSIDPSTFQPERDLVRVEDERAWWESEHDQNDHEDDHIVHHSLERPLRRLIELVSREGGILEIHDAYRATGIHNRASLHKEGRAVDVTCDEMSLEDLAKLCWSAGFDWVYYERLKGKGPHIHCSVRR